MYKATVRKLQTCIFRVRFVDEMHEEEEVIGKVVFFHRVRLEAVRVFVEVICPDAANEALGFHVFLHLLQLASQLAKGVDDQT